MPVFVLVLWVVPAGWAYWLDAGDELRARERTGQPGSPRRERVKPWLGALLALVIGFVLSVETHGRRVAWIWWLLTAGAALALLLWRLARYAARGEAAAASEEADARSLAIHRSLEVRNRLSLWLTRSLIVAAGLLGLATIDSLGQTFYGWHWAGTGARILGLAMILVSLFVEGQDLPQRFAGIQGLGFARPELDDDQELDDP